MENEVRTIDEAIDFCNEKSQNIKLKTLPQTFINITRYLKKLKAYLAIGTVDEFKSLKEKAEPKKVIGIKSNLQNRYCPSCNEWAVFELKKNMNYCPNCGQALDWSE